MPAITTHHSTLKVRPKEFSTLQLVCAKQTSYGNQPTLYRLSTWVGFAAIAHPSILPPKPESVSINPDQFLSDVCATEISYMRYLWLRQMMTFTVHNSQATNPDALHTNCFSYQDLPIASISSLFYAGLQESFNRRQGDPSQRNSAYFQGHENSNSKRPWDVLPKTVRGHHVANFWIIRWHHYLCSSSLSSVVLKSPIPLFQLRRGVCNSCIH